MEELKKHIREVPDFPKKGILFYDLTTLMKNPEAFRTVNGLFFEQYKDKNIDVIASIESRGFIFGAVLADKLGIPFVPIRKPGKLPSETISESYALEYGENTIEIHKDAIEKGQRVVLLDDLLATGGTVKAAANLVEKLGGVVAGMGFLVELDFLAPRKLIGDGYEIFSIMHY